MFFLSLLFVCFSWAEPPDRSDPLVGTRNLLSAMLGDRIEPENLDRAALQGMMRHIDELTGLSGSEVMTVEEKDAFLNHQIGLREGYGLNVRILNNRGLLVEEVLPDGMAINAGLLEKDLIVSVDNHPFTGRSSAEMLTLLHQPGSTKVAFDVLRRGKLRRFSVQRGQYQINNISRGAKSLRFQFFGRGSAAHLRRMLQDKSSGALVIDLRDNVGGMIEEVSRCLGVFIGPEIVIGHRKSMSGEVTPILSQGASLKRRHKIHLLVNRGTSGAAEFFVAAMKNSLNAVVVGEASAGKGAEVNFYPLGNDLFLKLADTEILDSKKESWNGVGIQPDIIVRSASSFPGKSGKVVDVQLETAIQLGTTP